MSLYFFFILFWKFVHGDIRRAARVYRMLFLAMLIAFAGFMIWIDIMGVYD